jgi:hypothetical protein
MFMIVVAILRKTIWTTALMKAIDDPKYAFKCISHEVTRNKIAHEVIR